MAIFWLLVDGLFWLLGLWPNSPISRAAFTWFGPKPLPGEPWSKYQWRWSLYSLGWVIQCALLFSVLLLVVAKWKLVELEGFVGVLLFALPFGIAMAGLAAVGFGLRAVKAHLVGPNPTYDDGSCGSAV